MPDVATGSDDHRRRGGRRPIIVHAGEVTREKKSGVPNDDATTEGPPLPTGRRIGGAKDFLKQNAPTITSADDDDSTRSIGDIGGIQALASNKTVTTNEPQHRSLAAQPGWRRYWTTLTYAQLHDWQGLPDLKVSDFCYACNNNNEPCAHLAISSVISPDAQVKCRYCTILSRECWFTISYRYHPDEDRDVARVPQYTMREFARNWQAAQGTLRSIDTLEESAPLQAPTWLRESTVRVVAKKSGQLPTVLQRIPIAQQWKTYEELAEIRTKDCFIIPREPEPIQYCPSELTGSWQAQGTSQSTNTLQKRGAVQLPALFGTSPKTLTSLAIDGSHQEGRPFWESHTIHIPSASNPFRNTGARIHGGLLPPRLILTGLSYDMPELEMEIRSRLKFWVFVKHGLEPYLHERAYMRQRYWGTRQDWPSQSKAVSVDTSFHSAYASLTKDRLLYFETCRKIEVAPMPPESTLKWLTTKPVSHGLRIPTPLHPHHHYFEWGACLSRKSIIFAVLLLEDSGPELYYIREPTSEVGQHTKPRVV